MFAYEYLRIYEHMKKRTSRPHQSAVLAWATLWSLTLFVLSILTFGPAVVFAAIGHTRQSFQGVSFVIVGGLMITCFAFLAGDDRVRTFTERFAAESPATQRLRNRLFKFHLGFVPVMCLFGPWLMRYVGR